MVPGAYFLDEAIWRGRMIAFASNLRGLLFELGFWVGAMYLAYPASKWWGACSFGRGWDRLPQDAPRLL
jgi:hypothetical protein